MPGDAERGIGTGKQEIIRIAGVALRRQTGAAFGLECFDNQGLKPADTVPIPSGHRPPLIFRFRQVGAHGEGTLSGLFQYTEDKPSFSGSQALTLQGSPASLSFADNSVARQNFYEVGYYYRFNPKAGFLAYFAHREFPLHVVSSSAVSANADIGVGFPVPVTQQSFLKRSDDLNSDNVQFQKNLILGSHNLIAGFDYFSSHNLQRFKRSTLPIELFGLPMSPGSGPSSSPSGPIAFTSWTTGA
jgi:hypothetical protein